jgi:NADH:ubiquinone oxidoreductase subunit 4 (subunit M)
VQLVPIIVMAVLMGVLPNVFLRPMAPAVERMLDLVHSEAPSAIRAELR